MYNYTGNSLYFPLSLNNCLIFCFKLTANSTPYSFLNCKSGYSSGGKANPINLVCIFINLSQAFQQSRILNPKIGSADYLQTVHIPFQKSRVFKFCSSALQLISLNLPELCKFQRKPCTCTVIFLTISLQLRTKCIYYGYYHSLQYNFKVKQLFTEGDLLAA